MAERFMVGQTAAPQGVTVPERLTKKFARNAALLKQKTEAIATLKKARRVARHGLLERGRKYAKAAKTEAHKSTALRRQAKETGNFYVEPEAKMMFVIRITGINKMAPKPRKILQLLRLDQLHKGVFVKCTKPMLNMLKCVQPYVIAGYPNLKTTTELICKRGYAKVKGERRPIENNDIISQNLGKYGIHGMSDLINEIYTVGPNFKEANAFLWAFKLKAPNGGFVLKKHGYHEPKGGDWGNREERINSLLRRMY